MIYEAFTSEPHYHHHVPTTCSTGRLSVCPSVSVSHMEFWLDKGRSDLVQIFHVVHVSDIAILRSVGPGSKIKIIGPYKAQIVSVFLVRK